MQRTQGFLVAALASFTLMGCSGPDSSDSEAVTEAGAAAPAEAANSATAQEVVVYSSRKEHLIKPLFDEFTQETGIIVTYTTDGEGPLMARLKAEAERTPADIFMTVDAGNLWQAAQTGLFRSVDSAELKANIPAQYRDSNDQWFGLSLRARTIVYSTERVDPANLSTYQALADPQWKGRLCLRTSKKVYNQSLVAMLIEHQGADVTEQMVKSWVGNLATTVFPNDTSLMEAIVAGQCDLGIVNTYYFGRLQKEKPDVPLKLFWPNQESTGVHVNVSGAGITKHAKHPKAAQQLLEWLSEGEAQAMFAGLNMEFPVNAKVSVDPLVKSWGDFKADALNVEVAGKRQVEAVKLMDRAGYQ